MVDNFLELACGLAAFMCQIAFTAHLNRIQAGESQFRKDQRA